MAGLRIGIFKEKRSNLKSNHPKVSSMGVKIHGLMLSTWKRNTYLSKIAWWKKKVFLWNDSQTPKRSGLNGSMSQISKLWTCWVLWGCHPIWPNHISSTLDFPANFRGPMGPLLNSPRFLTSPESVLIRDSLHDLMEISRRAPRI